MLAQRVRKIILAECKHALEAYMYMLTTIILFGINIAPLATFISHSKWQKIRLGLT